jgi:hypothetical protein
MGTTDSAVQTGERRAGHPLLPTPVLPRYGDPRYSGAIPLEVKAGGILSIRSIRRSRKAPPTRDMTATRRQDKTAPHHTVRELHSTGHYAGPVTPPPWSIKGGGC